MTPTARTNAVLGQRGYYRIAGLECAVLGLAAWSGDGLVTGVAFLFGVCAGAFFTIGFLSAPVAKLDNAADS